MMNSIFDHIARDDLNLTVDGLCEKVMEQQTRIEALEAALRELLELHDSDHQTDNDVAIINFIRAALPPEPDKDG